MLNGFYAVILKSANCTDTSACVRIAREGITTNNENKKISISPNPTNDFVKITTDLNLIGSKFNITDVAGRVVMNGVILHENQQVNLQALSNGVYFLNIETLSGCTLRIHKN